MHVALADVLKYILIYLNLISITNQDAIRSIKNADQGSMFYGSSRPNSQQSATHKLRIYPSLHPTSKNWRGNRILNPILKLMHFAKPSKKIMPRKSERQVIYFIVTRTPNDNNVDVGLKVIYIQYIYYYFIQGSECKCGKHGYETIVQFYKTQAEDYLWFTEKRKIPICLGGLISPQHVLSAKSCFLTVDNQAVTKKYF